MSLVYNILQNFSKFPLIVVTCWQIGQHFCCPMSKIPIFGPKLAEKSRKSEKSKIWSDEVLDNPILHFWSKFWVQRTFWSQVISILVIFHNSHLKFGQTMENGHFRDSRRAISRLRSKLSKFRKKRLLTLTEHYHICSNWKLTQKYPLPPPPITLRFIKSLWLY